MRLLRAFALALAVLVAPRASADNTCDLPRIAAECAEVKAQLEQRARKAPLRADEAAAAALADRCIKLAKAVGQGLAASERRRPYLDLLPALEAVRKKDLELSKQKPVPPTRPPPRPPNFVSVVQKFGRYRGSARADFNALPKAEKDKIDQLARRISDSFTPGSFPIVRAQIVGHADVDRQKGAAFEKRMSEERASMMKIILLERLRAITIPSIAKNLVVTTEGRGAAQPVPENRGKNPDRLTEPQRQLNRRVEVTLIAGTTPVPVPRRPSPQAAPPPAIIAGFGRGVRHLPTWGALVRAEGECLRRQWFINGSLEQLKKKNPRLWRKQREREVLEELVPKVFTCIDTGLLFSTAQEILKPSSPADAPDTIAGSWDDLVRERRARSSDPRRPENDGCSLP